MERGRKGSKMGREKKEGIRRRIEGRNVMKRGIEGRMIRKEIDGKKMIESGIEEREIKSGIEGWKIERG